MTTSKSVRTLLDVLMIANAERRKYLRLSRNFYLAFIVNYHFREIIYHFNFTCYTNIFIYIERLRCRVILVSLIYPDNKVQKLIGIRCAKIKERWTVFHCFNKCCVG